MKAARILQFLILTVILAYLLLLHSANQTNVNLPFFLDLPPAVLAAVALLLGWLLGWVPGRVGRWRKEREIRRLERRLSELEQHRPHYEKSAYEEDEPIIPDRTGVFPASKSSKQNPDYENF